MVNQIIDTIGRVFSGGGAPHESGKIAVVQRLLARGLLVLHCHNCRSPRTLDGVLGRASEMKITVVTIFRNRNFISSGIHHFRYKVAIVIGLY